MTPKLTNMASGTTIFQSFLSTKAVMRFCLFLLLIFYVVLFVTLTVREPEHQNTVLSITPVLPQTRIPTNSSDIVKDESSAVVTPKLSLQRLHLAQNYSFTRGIVEDGVEYYMTSNQPLWEHSTILPLWMKQYFAWHRQQRQWLHQHPEQWKSMRYYLVECTERYPNCGGTADRLGSLPFHVQFAARSRRLLLYHWTRPATLESFLLPPQLGVDWRLPPWLQQQFDSLPFPTMRNRRRRRTNNVTVALDVRDLTESLAASQPPILVRAKIQSHDHGASNYNDMIFWKAGDDKEAHSFEISSEPTFHQVFHDLWRVFFTPAPAVATKIQEQVISLGLHPPGSYIAMHLRLLYGKNPMSDVQMVSWTRNMIHCTLQYLVPAFHQTNDVPIELSSTSQPSIPTLLFVSDSVQASREAVAYAKILEIPLVVRSTTTNENPLHLEKDMQRPVTSQSGTVANSVVEGLYDTFVDIYSIGMSQCVAYQAGGFGRWGSTMSYNSSCHFFLKPGQPEMCPQPKPQGVTAKTMLHRETFGPLFLPPMQ
jgi:hypothetical protein